MNRARLPGPRPLVVLSTHVVLLVVAPAHAQGYDTSGAPDELPYRVGDPIPLGYHVEQSARGDTVAAGSVLFGLAYGAAVAVGASDGFQNHKGFLLLPVFGPTLTAATRTDEPRRVNLAVIFESALDSALQIYGVGLVLREELIPPTRIVRDAKLRLSVSPELARGFWGFSLTGQL